MAGLDIRQHGSKNAGATNTMRVLGTGPAILVLVLDALKGIAAIIIASFITTEPLWIILTGVAAIVGHNWPLFFGFKGGKGVATTIGVLAVLSFWPALAAGVFAIITIVIFRYVSLGSLVFVTLVPLFLALFYYYTDLEYTVGHLLGALLIMGLSYLRHRTNIVRLLRGEENKIGGRL